MESMHDLEVLIDSGRRLIVVETEREGCFIEGFRRISKRSGSAYFVWTVTQGLLRLSRDYAAQTINKDVNQLFAQIQASETPSVFVLVDFHHYLDEPVVLRHIKDVLLHAPQHCLVLLSQQIEMPDELKSLSTEYRLPLPNKQQLSDMVNTLALEWRDRHGSMVELEHNDMIEKLVENLCGLKFSDAQRMARHAIFNDGIIDRTDLDDVAKNKFALLNHNNVLNLVLDFAELEDIAGFENLKRWLKLRQPIFSGEVELPGEDKPRGMLLLGVQGCGKSLAAKAVAGSWGLPLLHLDFGTLYNRFYGQTEENLRTALDTAAGLQPCVLWIDEIEKGLSAVSGTDDVSKRLLGTFLTWLAEREAAVFVVATANDIQALPPELVRKGRFDEVFFVDLPDAPVRAAIFALHMRRREQSLEGLDLTAVVEQTRGFSGAEIEQLVVSALYQSYGEQRPIDTELLLSLIASTAPLSVLMAEKIAYLRNWASQRAVEV
ncbi:MAG: AAA family ATPase [Gammaproteobacteria bacterium]|nr:AAA family ATPase [Gammaproteobacteria bacterium]